MSISSSVSKNVALALLFYFPLAVSTASAHGGGEKSGRRGPPPEAIEACADLAVDQACQFISPRGREVSGTCFAPPRDEAPLACRPAGMKDHQGPPEADSDQGS